jgi:tetratricopeptide (TPR) repeat protein
VERYGFETLTTLIRRYAGNMSQQAIFKAVLHTSISDLESSFFAWLKARAQGINIYVGEAADADLSANQGDGPPSSKLQHEMLVEKLKQRIAAQPRDFQAHLQLGTLLLAAKDDQGAIDHLVIARDLLPDYNAWPNPREILAEIYKDRGDIPSMIRELEALARIKQNAFGACTTLGRIAWERKAYDRAVYYLERALAVNPYDPEVHRLLGSAALERSDFPKAVREFEVRLALDQTDPALAATDLAEAHLRGGDKARAKHYALAALEIAPMYPRAQNILLDAMEP